MMDRKRIVFGELAAQFKAKVSIALGTYPPNRERLELLVDQFFDELEAEEDETPLELAGFQEYLASRLQTNGVTSVEHLISMTPEAVERLDGIGPDLLGRIEKRLKACGLALSQKSDFTTQAIAS